MAQSPVWTKDKISYIRLGGQSARGVSIISYIEITETISESTEIQEGAPEVTETISESVVVTQV